MKKMEFYEGEEQQKRVEAVMRAMLTPLKVPKLEPPKRPQSSAK
jgi:hypothetical protein